MEHLRSDLLSCTVSIAWVMAAFFLGRSGAGWPPLTLLCAAVSAGTLLLSRRRRGRERKLVDLSQRDSLTGLYNRRSTEDCINRVLNQQGPEGQHVLILFDLDNFKQVNDLRGHGAGDLVLSAFSRLLRQHFRGGDILGRLGGDEFVVLLRDCGDQTQALARLNQFRRQLDQLSFDAYPGLGVSVSCGLACAPDHGSSFDQLFKQADQALYLAKADGKRAVRLAPPPRA